MMRAAVYARKSNEQDVQEEVRSVTRQLEHGRAFAESKGWSVKDDHVFSDDAISGMHGEEKRPGLKLLLATMELVPRPFDVIVMASDDRLMRNQLKVGAVLERIQEAGVDLYYYLENRKVDLSTVVGQFMESVHAMAAHDYRVKLARHTRDGMKARAKAGFVIGGRTFGYDHVPVDRGEVSTRKTRRVPMTRVINEAQDAQQSSRDSRAGRQTWHPDAPLESAPGPRDPPACPLHRGPPLHLERRTDPSRAPRPAHH